MEFSVRIRIPLSLLAAAGIAVLASCHHATQPSGRSAAPSATQPVAAAAQNHWVQNQQLKAAMGEIARLHGSLPKDLPEDVESPTGRMVALAAANAATAADNLAATAAGLPRLLEGKSLSEADRRGFLALGQTLSDQAIRLRGDSEKLQVEQMQRSMQAVTATCIACHGRYRDLAGEVDLNKTLIPRGTPAGPAAKNTP
jgi:hypothetical protein